MIVGDSIRSFKLELPEPEIPKPWTARIAAKATNPAIPSNLERFLSRILCFLSVPTLGQRHAGASRSSTTRTVTWKALLAGQGVAMARRAQRRRIYRPSNHEVITDNPRCHNISALI